MRDVGIISMIETSPGYLNAPEYRGRIARVRGQEFPFAFLPHTKYPLLLLNTSVTFELVCNSDGSNPVAGHIRLLSEEWEQHTLISALLCKNPGIASEAALRIENLYASRKLAAKDIGSRLSEQSQ